MLRGELTLVTLPQVVVDFFSLPFPLQPFLHLLHLLGFLNIFISHGSILLGNPLLLPLTSLGSKLDWIGLGILPVDIIVIA